MDKCKFCGHPVNEGDHCPECDKIEKVKSELPSEIAEEEQVLELTADSIIEVKPAEDSQIKDICDAVKKGNLKAVTKFISDGINVNTKADKGWTPIHEAAKDGNLEMVRLLIEKRADVNITNERGWTPLHRAANYGHLNVVELLFKKGADLNVKDNDGFSPLAFALRNKNLGIASFLIENGINPNGSIDEKNRPALVYALKNGMWGIAELLIDRGADPNAKDGKEPVLIFIMKNDRYDLAKKLIENGADPNVSDNNECALMLAFRTKHFEFAKHLIEKGADVNCADSNKDTPLHYAAQAGDKSLVERLIQKKAKLLCADRGGNLPLHKSSSKEVSSFLRKKMFPSKIIYSLEVFILVFLLTSVTIPLILAYVFSGLLLIMTLVFGDWPKKSSFRMYLLETFAVYLLVTNFFDIHADSFNYPFLFLIIPVVCVILFNLVFRPAFLFIGAVNADGSKPKFNEFMKEHLLSKISYSPLTLLRTLNVLVIAVIFILSVINNYDHLKKSDNYLFSYVIRAIPERDHSITIPVAGKDKTVKVIKKEKYKSVDPKKELETALQQYLKKDFDNAMINLEKASQSDITEVRANEMKFNLIRFMKISERLQRPNLSSTHKIALTNHLIKADKAISGGQFEEKLKESIKGLKPEKAAPPVKEPAKAENQKDTQKE